MSVKASIPASGNIAVPVPDNTLYFAITVTPDFQTKYLAYVEEKGLDGGSQIELLLLLGVTALQEIFDEKENRPPKES